VSAPPRTPSAGEALTLALAFVKGLDCDIAVTHPPQDAVANGSVRYSTQSATVTSKIRSGDSVVSIAATQIGSKLWVKIDLGTTNGKLGLNARKWYLVDQAKLTGHRKKMFDVDNYDALDIAGLMVSTSGVVRKDAKHVAGSVDLTRSTGVSAPRPDDLGKAGPGAAAVPFIATIDDQGRLVDLLVQADAIDADLTNEYAFSNFGAVGAITAPAPADVAPTPTAVYTIFNGF
jgi:hypothetical protein